MQEREFAGNRRGRIIRIAFGVCVFAFLLLFFGRIHPLMMLGATGRSRDRHCCAPDPIMTD